MATERIYTGKHGMITLNPSAKQGLETEKNESKTILTGYFGGGSNAGDPEPVVVGRATGLRIAVQTNLAELHEIGKRLPQVLHPGDINFSGSIDRAYISGALIMLLLGRGATLKDTEPFVQPAFDIFVDLKDPLVKGGQGDSYMPRHPQSRLEIIGVRFQNWSFTIPEDDFVMENVTFRALDLNVIDKTNEGQEIKPFG